MADDVDVPPMVRISVLLSGALINSPATCEVVVANVPLPPPLEPVMVLHPKTPLFQVTAFEAELHVESPAPVKVEATLSAVVVALVVVELVAVNF